MELQHLSGRLLPPEALETMTVDGLYDVARDSLADPAFTFAYDPRLGVPTKLSWAAAAEPSAAAPSRPSTTSRPPPIASRRRARAWRSRMR